MITQKKAANAVGGNTARACDSCLVKRARWFCAADDAFLCQRCDSTVHSANQLASRHERVRLKGSSGAMQLAAEGQSAPAWHRGFTRKARTPRPNNKVAVRQSAKSTNQEKVVFNPPLPFVPEIGCDEANCFDDDENEDLEQLLYRVPIYDPFADDLCNLSNEVGNSNAVDVVDDEVVEIRMENNHEVGDDKNCGGQDGHDDELENLQGLLPSDMELAEFAADVENLLGGGLEEDSSDIKGVMGLMDDDGKLLQEDGGLDVCMKAVKVEGEEGMQFNPSMLDWSLGYDEPSPVLLGSEDEEEKEPKVMVLLGAEEEHREEMMMKRKIFLRLNHEAVIAAWASQGGSPWTTGTRPEFNPDDAWLDCMGMWPSEFHQGHGDGSSGSLMGRGDDRGREARVSRYREKRRTRLFSKKIRYEVRKLNAEKRPRMKGRFVKRTSASNFVGSGSGNSSSGNSAAFPYMVNK